MKTKVVDASPAHKQLHKELSEFLRDQCDKLNLSGEDLLAIQAYMVGQTVALQDHRKWTSDAVMSFVAANIQAGNQSILDQVQTPQGSA